MSEELRTADGRLIKWNRGDRMRKALDVAEISVQDMADYLDVDRSTVSTWLNNRIDPSYTGLRLWSLRTGAPLRWLHHGDTEPCDLEMVRVVAGQGTKRHRANKMQSSRTKIAV